MSGVSNKVTPMMDLMMEVLAARFRLGESFWTFANSTGHKFAANRLEEKGWVTWDNGNVQDTIRVYLTDKGKTVWGLDKPHKSPKELGLTPSAVVADKRSKSQLREAFLKGFRAGFEISEDWRD